MTSSKDAFDLKAGSKDNDKAGDKIGDKYDDKADDKIGGKIFSDDKAFASDASASGEGMSAEEALIAQVAKDAEATAQSAVTDGVEEGVESGLEARVLDLSDKLSRALAEVENARRRFEREKGDALRYGASRLAADMFEVADNLRRACGFVSAEAREGDENLRNLVVGIEMTEKMLGDAFSRHGIVVIEPEVGTMFNADEHQAVSEIEDRDVEEGCVVEVVLRGYRMGERLLRPAQVVTAMRKGEETATETETSQEKEEETENEKEKNGDASRSNP